jgi:hypothetical protein
MALKLNKKQKQTGTKYTEKAWKNMWFIDWACS